MVAQALAPAGTQDMFALDPAPLPLLQPSLVSHKQASAYTFEALLGSLSVAGGSQGWGLC